jgi:predicted TIM-barrel fold metal-dependent hydrolase
VERSPYHKQQIGAAQGANQQFLREAGLQTTPSELTSYLRYVDDTLARWRAQGAVALKFGEAYYRTLRIADVRQARAAELYVRGRTTPLPREEYIELQDFLWRYILLKCGEIGLPVHIHAGLGNPPFLRTLEADPRNLDEVLTDPRFFKTPIVLIHGGGDEIGPYLGLKPNVWLDISSMAFVVPTPEVAAMLRVNLVLAPSKVLFGTDAGAGPTRPQSDVNHILLSRATREALYLALATLLRDGVITESQALEMGRGVLRENARRLYGWS